DQTNEFHVHDHKPSNERRSLPVPAVCDKIPSWSDSKMMSRIFATVVIASAALAGLLAQTNNSPKAPEIFKQPPKVTGPAPHLADGTPDLSGVWMGGGS